MADNRPERSAGAGDRNRAQRRQRIEWQLRDERRDAEREIRRARRARRSR